MSVSRRVLKRVETHMGRDLDLNDRRDRFRFLEALDREISDRDRIISNVRKSLDGWDTYDQSRYKPIVDRTRLGWKENSET